MEQEATTVCPSGGATCHGWEVLAYRHLGCKSLPDESCADISNFLDDLYFYIPSGNNLRALEFDPDVYTGTDELFMSMQCDSATGNWRFWSMSTSSWVQRDTTYPCDVLSETNSWHHFQLYGTMDQTANNYTYETLVVDGVTIYQNIDATYDGKAYTSSQDLNIEQQIDSLAVSATNTMYYDNYNFWVW